MKTGVKTFITVGVALAALALVAAVAARPMLSGCMGHGKGLMHNPERIRQVATWIVDDVLDKIEATPQQRERVHALKDEMLTRAGALHQECQANHARFLAEFKRERPDMTNVHAMIDQAAAKKVAFAHEIADAVLKLHDILTPAQRNQLVALAEEHLTAH
ncbi:MAG: Spy/CpxP family protein refolding chaperone [Acidobacteria bacterium]|nr:Spy/CpxP family protein refolding chaperone [Acidobacteriota bacterium]